MNTVKVGKSYVIKKLERFFDKENERIAKEHHDFLIEQSSKRRFFGLFAPKEVDWDFIPTIEHSMAFQHMWPHHEAKDLLEIAKLSGNSQTMFVVDVSFWAEIERVIK